LMRAPPNTLDAHEILFRAKGHPRNAVSKAFYENYV
jgi:hypothetical protein